LAYKIHVARMAANAKGQDVAELVLDFKDEAWEASQDKSAFVPLEIELNWDATIDSSLDRAIDTTFYNHRERGFVNKDSSKPVYEALVAHCQHHGLRCTASGSGPAPSRRNPRPSPTGARIPRSKKPSLSWPRRRSGSRPS
jgi:hypothetical protein